MIKKEPITLIWRELLEDGRQVVVKLYRRRPATWCRGMITGFRAHREFDGLRQLETLGIPCSLPLFWSHGRFGLHGWGEVLVTEWVARSLSLRDLIATRPEASGSLDLCSLFADMARIHAAGLHHGTLTGRNILVQNYPERPVFLFIDMPRFHRFPRDIRSTRMAYYDLMSLCQGLLPYYPEDKVLLWLSAYGIPEFEKMGLLVRLKRFRSTGFLRRVLGAEFNVRMAMAKIFTFYPPKPPKSRQPSGWRPF